MSALEGCDNVSAVIDISNSSYIRIENLEIRPWSSNSIMRDGILGLGANLKYVMLKDLRINYLNEFGINIGDVDHITIDNCRITYCGFGAIGGPEGSYGGWRNAVIKNSVLSYSGHFYRGGTNPYDRPDGFGIEESDGPIEIHDTRAEHNKGDGLDSKARNTYIHHCIVANNSCDGVKLWGGGSKIENTLIYGTGDGVGGSSPWAGIVIGTTEQDAEFEIVNVTIHDNPEREAYPIYVQYDEDVPISVLFRNTIIAGGYGHVYFKDVVDLTADHNLFYMPGRDDQIFANGRTYGINELTQLGAGNVFANPLFISAAWGAVGNYKVFTGSPAIDTGTSNGAPSDDLEHTSRPQGVDYDKGSYEQ